MKRNHDINEPCLVMCRVPGGFQLRGISGSLKKNMKAALQKRPEIQRIEENGVHNSNINARQFKSL